MLLCKSVICCSMVFVLWFQASSNWNISTFNVANIFSKGLLEFWGLCSIMILYNGIFSGGIFIFVLKIMSSVISLPQSSMLLFILKFSQNPVLTISMSVVFHLGFQLLKVEVTNMVNTFQDLVNILHLAICSTSTKVLPSIKLFHLSLPDVSSWHLWFFPFVTAMYFTNSATQSKFVSIYGVYGIISYSSSFTVIPNNISYSIFIHESWDLTTVRPNTRFLSA